MASDDQMTLSQAAELVGRTKRALQYHVESGRLPAVLLDGRYYVRESDLDLVRDVPRGRPLGSNG